MLITQLHFGILRITDIHNPLVMTIYTNTNLNSLRNECEDLDDLIISANDIEFIAILGEGILCNNA